MRLKWYVIAAAATLTAVPALAQTDATVVVTAPGAAAVTTGTTYTNVDVTKVRASMDDLRGFINRIRENETLAWSTSDVVHLDAYRRTNDILLDNASGIALSLVDMAGPATSVPPGLGATRAYLNMVNDHLAHARMMHDFGAPIDEAKKALDNAYESLDQANTAMSGSNMAGMGMRGTMGTMGTSDTTGTTDTTGSMGTMGTSGTTDTTGTTDATKNQSNPGLNNYNQQNNAGTGVGAVTPVPNTTPGEPGTGNTDTNNTTPSDNTAPGQ